MMQPDRVVRPLDEAAPSIEMLERYESPVTLEEALRATWHAVEQTLRRLLRSDTGAPDEIRMTALSAELLPTDTLLAELRRRNLISLELAGRVHELRRAVDRAPLVRATDADAGLDVVATLRSEILARDLSSGRAAEQAAHVTTIASQGENPAPGKPSNPIQGPRRPVYVIAATLVALAAVAVAVSLFGRESHLDQAIAAFEEDRHADAEQHFRAALRDDAADVTAHLYLARILRVQDRAREAADLLTAAVAVAPTDAAVRRELGHLFNDLGRPTAALDQFEQAVELEPGEPLNWVGLVQTLRRVQDPSADEWFARAPAAAREMLGGRQ